MAFSPDIRTVVSAFADQRLQLSDACTGSVIWDSIKSDGGYVNTVAFSPDGRHLVSAHVDGLLRLRETSTGVEVGVPLKAHEDEVIAAAFSPDGRRIISGSRDEKLILWNAETGVPVGAPFQGHTSMIAVVAISSDGRHIVSGSFDETLRFWEMDTHCELARFETEAPIRSIAVTGSTLVAGDEGGRVHILDIITDEFAKTRWLARIDGTGRGSASALLAAAPAVGLVQKTRRSAVSYPTPMPPPVDVASIAPEMQVTDADLAGTHFLETYRGRNLFALADGRIYLDGLIAVATLDHARATLDELARRAGKPDA